MSRLSSSDRTGAGYSRRDFLATSSLAAAGMALGARRLSAADVARGITANTAMAEPLTASFLQSLATAAMDAAKSAGATFADVRVGESQSYYVAKTPNGPLAFAVGGDVYASFGVRVIVNGGWGFVHGDEPTVDAITAAAKGAVAQAKNVPKGLSVGLEYAAAKSVTGEWTAPMEIDPFQIPIHEQMSLIRSWMDTCGALLDVGGLPSFSWSREMRVYAATDGSLVTQRYRKANPRFNVGGTRMMGGEGASLAVPIPARMGGYEVVSDVAIHEKIRATGEEVQRYIVMPGKPMDVGRYPVVFDGTTLGTVLYQTLGQALELDRVLGEEADASGTSYLVPMEKELGTVVMAPALNLNVDRAVPSVTGTKWDDEGVEPVAGPLITAGALVDYQSSRKTAAAMEAWYKQRNKPVASMGYAVAPEPRHPVQVRCGHLTVVPSTSSAAIEDLIHGMARGIVVRGANWVSTDQQLSSGNLPSYGALLLEVEKGKIVRRIKDGALEWSTVPFLKKMLAVGDKSTVQEATGETFKGVPWHRSQYHTTAPAALFKEVHLIDIGREL